MQVNATNRRVDSKEKHDSTLQLCGTRLWIRVRYRCWECAAVGVEAGVGMAMTKHLPRRCRFRYQDGVADDGLRQEWQPNVGAHIDALFQVGSSWSYHYSRLLGMDQQLQHE